MSVTGGAGSPSAIELKVFKAEIEAKQQKLNDRFMARKIEFAEYSEQSSILNSQLRSLHRIEKRILENTK